MSIGSCKAELRTGTVLQGTRSEWQHLDQVEAALVTGCAYARAWRWVTVQLFKSTAKGKHSWEGTLEAAEREHRLYIPKEKRIRTQQKLIRISPGPKFRLYTNKCYDFSIERSHSETG